MTFAGRGFRRPSFTTTATATGVTYRVDCAERDEPWGEFHLSREDLVRAIEMIDEVRHEGPFAAAEPELGEAGA